MRKFEIIDPGYEMIGMCIVDVVQSGKFDQFIEDKEKCGYRFVCFTSDATGNALMLFERINH